MRKLFVYLLAVYLFQFTSVSAATLQVYAAVNQPQSYLAFPNATRVGFTRVFLFNPGTTPIKAKLRVQQNGLADWVFRSVVLLDDNYNQIGTSDVLDENRQAVIGESLEILPGTSKPVVVAGNMDSDLSSSAGGWVRLDVVGVETDAIVDAPQIPITAGTAHIINASLVLGTATAYLSVFDPMVPQTIRAGTTGYRFSGIRVISGSAEKIRLRGIVFTQTISPQHGLTPAKISNVEVVVDGVHYPTEVRRNIDVVHYPLPDRCDRYTAQFGQGVVVDKGFSKDIYIQGDLDDSTETRLLKMDIFSDLDVYATGETYGYGVPIYEGTVSVGPGQYSRFPGGYPWFSGSLLTVEANAKAVLTVSVSASTPKSLPAMGNVAVVLFEVKAKSIRPGNQMLWRGWQLEFEVSSGLVSSLGTIKVLNGDGQLIKEQVIITRGDNPRKGIVFLESPDSGNSSGYSLKSEETLTVAFSTVGLAGADITVTSTVLWVADFGGTNLRYGDIVSSSGSVSTIVHVQEETSSSPGPSGGGGGGGEPTGPVQIPTPVTPVTTLTQTTVQFANGTPTKATLQVLVNQDGNPWLAVFVDRQLSPKVQVQYSRNGAWYCRVPDIDLCVSPTLRAFAIALHQEGSISIMVYEDQ